jgi:hypothetical protein
MTYFKIYKSSPRPQKIQVGGKWYDSKFEGFYSLELESRKKKGEITRYDTHVKLDLVCNGYKLGEYEIDFIAYRPDGVKEYIETKGWASPDFKWRWKILETMVADDPNIEMKLVMQKPFKYRKPAKVFP